MKINVNTKNLIKILNSVSANIPKGNSILPITKFVLLSTEGDRLKATTANDRVQMSHFYTMAEEKDFKACVVCDKLLNTLKKLNEEAITLELKERKNGSSYLYIKYGKSSCKIEACNPDDFINLNFDNYIGQFKVNGPELFEKMNSCNKCTIANDIRIQFSCVSIEASQGISIMKSFNPILGTEQEVNVEGDCPVMLIDRQSVGLITSFEYSGETIVYNNGKRAKFFNGSFEIIVTLTDAPALKVDSIYQSKQPGYFEVNRLELLTACERAVNFASYENHLIKLDIADGDILMTANDEDNSNEVEEYVNISNKSTADLIIGLDGTKIPLLLSSMKHDNIVVHTSSLNKPVFISETSENPKERWVIMPMMLDNVVSKRNKD